MYNLTLQRWIKNQIEITQLELLVKTNWLTREQANTIKNTERIP